jgi:hypothetical protein
VPDETEHKMQGQALSPPRPPPGGLAVASFDYRAMALTTAGGGASSPVLPSLEHGDTAPWLQRCAVSPLYFDMRIIDRA